MTKVRVVAQGVEPKLVDPKKLTSDCMTIVREDGIVDIIRCHKAVDAFDFYHDLGIRVKSINRSWGHRNPKFHEPEV